MWRARLAINAGLLAVSAATIIEAITMHGLAITSTRPV